MKRMLCLVLVLLLVGSVAFAGEEHPEEILFRNTPWGISYDEADSLFSEYGLMDNFTGERMRFYPIVELYSNTYDWDTDPEYHDINIPAYCLHHKFDVAGYTTTDITLHFAYTVVDGVITHNTADTRMYGAQYKFEPVDSEAMVDDLTSKLSGLYGDIDETGTDGLSGTLEYKWWIWKGANNTAVSLTLEDCQNGGFDDAVWISYFTYDGDEWLYEASDGEKERLLRKQRSGAESGSTDGL